MNIDALLARRDLLIADQDTSTKMAFDLIDEIVAAGHLTRADAAFALAIVGCSVLQGHRLASRAKIVHVLGLGRRPKKRSRKSKR